MKLLLRVLFPVLALGVIGWIWVGSLLAAAVERGGTYALGVETRLESARLSPFAGEIDLVGLSVANPPGFRREHFLRLERCEVEVEPGSLLGERIEAPRLVLEGVEIDLERRDDATNYGTILESLERFEGEGGSRAGGTEPGDGEGSKRLVIREVVVRDAAAHVSLSALGVGVSETVRLPEIRLTDVGEKTVPELVAQLVTALLDVSTGSLEGVVPADLLRDLESRMASFDELSAGLETRARERIEGALREAGEEVSEELEKTIEGARRGLEDALRGGGGGS